MHFKSAVYPLLFPPLCFVAARVAEHCGMDLRTIVSDIDPKHLQVLFILQSKSPGAKVRVITREAQYYVKTRAFASFYAIISRAHAARAVT